MLAATSISAQPSAPRGADALARARAAWEKGDFDVAEPLYKEAIDKGGLTPDDVVDAYLHLGAARAVLGKLKPSLDAFREAAVIDPKFEVPPEAGKRAKQIADRARYEKRKIGAIALSVQAPSTGKPGESFGVDATLDDAHVKIVKQFGIFVRDPLSGKNYQATTAPAAAVHFDVPANFTLPSATLVVRVDALDAHENRLATGESKVRIEAMPAKVADAPPPHSDKARSGARDRDRDREKEKPKSGGFWSSPWPYVIGGVALAAGGAAAYVFTRPTDDVSLAGPRAVTVH
jgi:hypothetical protein